MEGLDTYDNYNLTTLNFERVKWGGVRHREILYCMFDLENFPKAYDFQPCAEDLNCLRAIFAAIDASEPDDGPAQLRKRIQKALPTNKAEASTLLEILCELDIPVSYTHLALNECCFNRKAL